MLRQAIPLAALCAILTGCGGENSTEFSVVPASFEEFVDEVQSSLSENAINCGIVGIDESELETNTCVASAFANNQSFYAAYQLQGFDSSVGAAITGNASGNVWLWTYDSNPSGGVPATPSKIESSECAEPSLTGSVDSGFDEIFGGCSDAELAPIPGSCQGFPTPATNVVVHDAINGDIIESAAVTIHVKGDENSQTLQAEYVQGDNSISNSEPGAYFAVIELHELNFVIDISVAARGYSEHYSEDIEFTVDTDCGAENTLHYTVHLCPEGSSCQ